MILLILLITSSFILQAPVIRYDEKVINQWKQWQQEQQLEVFLDSIAYYESGNDPTEHNEFGYIGKYQFGFSARKLTGFDYITFKKFINNPNIWAEWEQDTAMLRLMKYNKLKLDSIISIYNDSVFNDILISKSGILAAAHLAGSRNVKRYFKSNGKYNPKDIYGTTLSYYLDKFSGYNF